MELGSENCLVGLLLGPHFTQGDQGLKSSRKKHKTGQYAPTPHQSQKNDPTHDASHVSDHVHIHVSASGESRVTTLGSLRRLAQALEARVLLQVCCRYFELPFANRIAVELV